MNKQLNVVGNTEVNVGSKCIVDVVLICYTVKYGW